MLPAEQKKERVAVEGTDWRGPVLNVVAKEGLIQMGTFDTGLRE